MTEPSTLLSDDDTRTAILQHQPGIMQRIIVDLMDGTPPTESYVFINAREHQLLLAYLLSRTPEQFIDAEVTVRGVCIYLYGVDGPGFINRIRDKLNPDHTFNKSYVPQNTPTDNGDVPDMFLVSDSGIVYRTHDMALVAAGIMEKAAKRREVPTTKAVSTTQRVMDRAFDKAARVYPAGKRELRQQAADFLPNLIQQVQKQIESGNGDGSV